MQRRRRRLEREAGVSLAPARGVFSFALARGATRRPSFSLLRAALLLLAPAPPPRAHVACAPLETDREAEGGERARVLFLSLSRFPTLPTSPSPPKVKERVLRGKQKYAGVVKEERRRARRSARVVPLLPSFFNRRAGVFLVSHAHTHNAARPSRVVLVAAVSPPCRRRVCLPRERGKEVGGALDKKSDKAGHWTKKSDKAGRGERVPVAPCLCPCDNTRQPVTRVSLSRCAREWPRPAVVCVLSSPLRRRPLERARARTGRASRSRPVAVAVAVARLPAWRQGGRSSPSPAFFRLARSNGRSSSPATPKTPAPRPITSPTPSRSLISAPDPLVPSRRTLGVCASFLLRPPLHLFLSRAENQTPPEQQASKQQP